MRQLQNKYHSSKEGLKLVKTKQNKNDPEMTDNSIHFYPIGTTVSVKVHGK